MTIKQKLTATMAVLMAVVSTLTLSSCAPKKSGPVVR